jgi:hypothetical protein
VPRGVKSRCFSHMRRPGSEAITLHAAERTASVRGAVATRYASCLAAGWKRG